MNDERRSCLAKPTPSAESGKVNPFGEVNPHGELIEVGLRISGLNLVHFR